MAAKSNSLDINEEEWFKELEFLEVDGKFATKDGAYSSSDLQRMTGRKDKWIRARLQKLHRAGKLEVGRRGETNLLGDIKWVPTYRLKGKGKKNGQ